MKNETNAGLNTGTIIALILLGAAAVFGLLYIFVFSDRDDPAGIKSVRFRRIRNKLRAFLSGGDVTPVTQVTGIAKDLCEELKNAGFENVIPVGDAVKVGRIQNATSSGYRAAVALQ